MALEAEGLEKRDVDWEEAGRRRLAGRLLLFFELAISPEVMVALWRWLVSGCSSENGTSVILFTHFLASLS